LVDSINKKLTVVEAIAAEIELKNVTVQHTRAEDIRDKRFDLIVSRAVAPLKDLWHWSKPLLNKKRVDQPKKITGLICLKGGDLSQEISESRLHPRVWEISKIFEEDFFKEKYILSIS
jgi:16S rRNA (guanine527-N7)-methyltransferase